VSAGEKALIPFLTAYLCEAGLPAQLCLKSGTKTNLIRRQHQMCVDDHGPFWQNYETNPGTRFLL